MLAVATFILFKSGQVVLTVTPGANGAATDASLNPYVVGFVAIISGLLSEQAYHRISDAGAQLLAAKDAGVSRWLRPSVAATAREKANRPGGELHRFVSTDLETIEGWLNGRKQIGPAEQGVVAAWLDMPRWEAFTDQQPNAGPGDGKTSDAKLRTDDAAANANQTGETPPTAGSDHAAPAGTAEAEITDQQPNAGPGDGKTSDAKLRTDDAAANANQTGETPPTAGSDHAAPAGTAEAENLEHRA